MKEVIRIMIVDYESEAEKTKCKNDLFRFCQTARIRKPVLLPLKGGDCYRVDLTGLNEHTALLWLHVLCDLAALNPHYCVELQQREVFDFDY